MRKSDKVRSNGCITNVGVKENNIYFFCHCEAVWTAVAIRFSKRLCILSTSSQNDTPTFETEPK